jgi:GNAT superfamily N-acetyltransferase
MAGPRERAIAWRHGAHARVCDVIEPWEHGTVVRCSRLPEFWSYNSLRVEGAAPTLGVDALVHASDVLQGDLGHRQVEVEDEATGARLRAGFEALGWAAERLAWMRLAGPPPPGPDFDEVPFSGTRPLRLEWTRAAPWAPDERAAERFADAEAEVAAVRDSRALLARDAAGEPIAFTVFVAEGGGAEIDQAYVTPSQRGRGVGGALVAAAARVAAAVDTFIVADDEGAPKRLYARLGFEPIWIQYVFTRRPG